MMRGRHFLTLLRRNLALCLVFILLLLPYNPVQAQSQQVPSIDLYNLQTDGFPTITAGLDVFDASGQPVSGLKADAVSLLEDNQSISPDKLEEINSGVEFALALDPGPAFAYRDANAVTRYDKIVKVINDWTTSASTTNGDDLSLIPTYGTLSTHLSTPSAFQAALEAYQPNLQSITPSLNTLARALDTVTETTPQPGMKRVVLFISSPTAVQDLPTLQSLTERAVGQHVHVDVWIVASVDFFNTASATALKDLAIQTGGQSVTFSGVEPLPDIETYLSPYRPTYRLTYTSAIRGSSAHTLGVRLTLAGETVSSPPLTFDLNIQPPNPMLVSPPEQIVRQTSDPNVTDTQAFLPQDQTINILIEFPDGRKRPLVSTALIVDNVKVAENTKEPFDQFTWALSSYAESGQHMLSVEAVDSLGLSKTSLAIPVTVTVVRPKFGLLPFLSRHSPWVALGAILFAGSLLAVILTRGQSRRRAKPTNHRANNDPLTQPVPGISGRRSLRLPRKRQANAYSAYLLRLKDDGQPVSAPPIPIDTQEITFGSDPLHATRILDDPSVSPLHARLKQDNGSYILFDEKSVAGTWVNYESLSSPRSLQHGDMIQIGRLAYRFMLVNPPVRPAPRVIPTKP